MGSESKKAFGAVGRDELLLFNPNDLVIVSDKDHPLYDERAFMQPEERLIESIMKVGVLEPIIVRKNGEDKTGKPIVEVVDGRQRVRAALIANARIKEAGGEEIRIPAVRKRGDGGDLLGIMITTNEIRKADPPMIKAKKVQRYLDIGRTLEEAAVTFGATVTTIKGYLALLDCHADVVKAIEAGRIGITHARKLAAMPQEEQKVELVKLLEHNKEASEEEESENITERIEKALGGRGKVRKRTQKTRKDIKTFRENLEGSRSQDAALAMAVLDWVMGNDEPLSKFRAISTRALSSDGEE